MQVERAMTEETGLESRPFYKHLIYAPQPTYRKEVLPRIFEAIETGEWEKIVGFEKELVTAFDRATELLKKAAHRYRGLIFPDPLFPDNRKIGDWSRTSPVPRSQTLPLANKR